MAQAEQAAKPAKAGTERVGGIDVPVTRLDKLFFPDDGITKGDLIQYYRRAAPAMVPYLRDRPLVMGRYPDGITGQGVVQKNVPGYFPAWITRTEVPKEHGGSLSQVVGDKPATIVYLANQGCIELHVFLSAVGALDRPDQLVVAPYSVRARPGAPVATPLAWAELDGDLSPRQFTIATMAGRLATTTDPWAGMARHRRSLSAPRRRLAALSAA